MAHPSDKSPYIKSAKELLTLLTQTPLSLEERCQKAVTLASLMLCESRRIATRKEKALQKKLANMMHRPEDKAFMTRFTDECFRSKSPVRSASQIIDLLKTLGIPSYLSFFERIQLKIFQLLGKRVASLLIPFVKRALRKQTSHVIISAESHLLTKHIKKRKKEGVKLNINHLGEAILGEGTARKRLDVYLRDLEREDIDYVSIKISTIYSQIHLIGKEETLLHLKERLKELYRAAMRHQVNGQAKFINLDMEEYKDLYLTTELFKEVLSESEFHHFSAGIVLQAYLPDSFSIQKELTEWAIKRVSTGGAPIKIRIVKGANLMMEKFEAAVHSWPQAPYLHKSDVDANYKRMVTFGATNNHAKAVHLGIASHNLFDIAYAMILRKEHGVEEAISFEMLEGMADSMRRVVQHLTKGMLLYCPLALKEDFEHAIAYLIRRLDENTGSENFLRHAFDLQAGTTEWEEQTDFFLTSCKNMTIVPTSPRKTQDRNDPLLLKQDMAAFENEPNTDFSLKANLAFAKHIVQNWKEKTLFDIPLVIGGAEITNTSHKKEGFDPSLPGQAIYSYALADISLANKALLAATHGEKVWSSKTVEERTHLLGVAANRFREKRGDLIGVMMRDGGKTISEGDPEVSEAIDFIEYYRRSALKMHLCKDVSWRPKGVILIAPPWNFPVSIPTGGIAASLAAGNSVLFKPAPEAVLTGWILVNLFWDAGVPKEALQFFNCPDDPVGTYLIKDPRINAVILTGATSTAKLFKKYNPKLDLIAETGGKNAMIISALSDRDLAIKELIESAFGHGGQKCSAVSLGILEKEVYDDPEFLRLLKDATLSLRVGSPWNLSNKIPPLIKAPEGDLLRGLTELEEGESFLVEPKIDPHNPHLVSPGIKLGVKKGSFMHQKELFGPILGLMRADNLKEAIHLANATPYGLTSGLQSLDAREHRLWIRHIVAGNCYINRTTTGAMVRRQPFGGCKESNYGSGAKSGGPNYVAQFAKGGQAGLPPERGPFSPRLKMLEHLASKLPLDVAALGLWHASLGSYSYFSKRFEEDHDPSLLYGQDNLFRYRPVQQMVLRAYGINTPLDLLRSLGAALLTNCPLEISYDAETFPIDNVFEIREKLKQFVWTEETEEHFLQRVSTKTFYRIRTLSIPTDPLYEAAKEHATTLLYNPVLANGRFELLHYLREIAVSFDYHRYGNLGLREKEKRAPIREA